MYIYEEEEEEDTRDDVIMARIIRAAVIDCARLLIPSLLVSVLLLNINLDFTYSIRNHLKIKKKMKEACMLGKAVETQKLSCAAAVKCLLLMLAVLSVLNPAMLPPFGFENDRTTSTWGSPIEERQNFNAMNSGGETRHLMKLAAQVQTDESVLGKEALFFDEIKENESVIESAGTDTSTELLEVNDKLDTKSSFNTLEKPAENKSFTGN
ncbi:uncharacterized protein LOC144571730 isoform X1 [Carex rostrata]